MTLRIFVAALALALAPGVRAFADQVPQLSVTARSLHATGAPGSATASPHPMVIAEGITSYVFASRDLCGLGAAKEAARSLDDLRRQKGHVWKVTRTGVSHSDGKLTFDLEWARYDGGSASPAASGIQRLTLNEGAKYPIDMIRAATAGDCNTAAVVLEVEASTIESPAFADQVLAYDLWLTHQDESGKKQTRHLLLMGKQGKAATFDFVPLRFDVPPVAPNQYDFDLVTRVLGTIKGRVREDGRIDVELETQRTDRLERADDPKPPQPRAGGRKTLALQPGETVEIELPRMSGFSAHAASADSPRASGGVTGSPAGTQAPAPAVALKDGMIVVNLKEFFAADRFSVLIRVRTEGHE
jgi:hypothetical protein